MCAKNHCKGTRPGWLLKDLARAYEKEKEKAQEPKSGDIFGELIILAELSKKMIFPSLFWRC